jgi:hypothetical protein
VALNQRDADEAGDVQKASANGDGNSDGDNDGDGGDTQAVLAPDTLSVVLGSHLGRSGQALHEALNNGVTSNVGDVNSCGREKHTEHGVVPVGASTMKKVRVCVCVFMCA